MRGALALLGAAAAGAGLIVAAVVTVAGLLVESHVGTIGGDAVLARAAVRALWEGFFSDLRTAALIAAVGGAVVAGLASRERVSRWLAGTRERLSGMSGSPGRPARAAVLIAVAAALLLAPGPTLRVAAAAVAVVLLLVGAAQLAERVPSDAGGESTRDNVPVLAAVIAVVVSVAAVVAVALVLSPPAPAPAGSAASASGCNGSRALCGRRLNEVMFPATHNSYAAADEPGWFFANQRSGIEGQLEDGIRGFLIDIHYGVEDPQTGRVRTDLAYEGASRNKVVRELSPEALGVAERLAGSVGRDLPDGSRRVYLCHTLCELGSERLDDQLEIFRRFLDANPRQVIVLFVEPYVPPREVEKGLEEARLLSEAAVMARDEPLPTLGELIGAGTRLVVLAEEDGGARPWYLDGFSFTQDTRLRATRPSQLRCRHYRGSPDSPLLLVNHWIPPFPPSVARNERIGGRYLQRRLGRCERRRGLLPNLVAVDFHERSGVVEAARRLNAASR